MRGCGVFQSEAGCPHRAARREAARSRDDFAEPHATDESPILPRRNYIEVVSRKNKKGKDARPEEKLCSHLTTAIHADGMDKGRLVKICADQNCKIQLWESARGRKTAAPVEGRKDRRKQESETDPRVPAPPLGRCAQASEAAIRSRGVAHGGAVCLALPIARPCVPPRQASRFTKPKDAHDWQVAEKARTLYKKADAAALAVLIFEAMLLDPAGSVTVTKDDDPLADAATLYKVDTKALRAALANTERGTAQRKDKVTAAKAKPTRKRRTTRK